MVDYPQISSFALSSSKQEIVASEMEMCAAQILRRRPAKAEHNRAIFDPQ